MNEKDIERYKSWKEEVGRIHERLAWIDNEIENNEELRRDYQSEINSLWDRHDELWNNVNTEWFGVENDN